MKRKILLLLTSIWLISSILIIQITYSKYLTTLSSSGTIGIAYWNIVVNEQDINNNLDITNTIELNIPETDYYTNDVMVPNAVGYFDLNIDATNVLVDFKYTITVNFPSDNDVTDLKIIGYDEYDNHNNITYFSNSSVNLERNVLAQTNSVIRVYVKWIDDDGETLNDYSQVLNDVDDTMASVNSGTAKINANIRFEQLQ